MAGISTVQLDARDVWAVDRHKAALAMRLLGGCLGIEAKPGFRIAVDDCEPEPRRPREIGECVFKDMAIGGESARTRRTSSSLWTRRATHWPSPPGRSA